MNKFILFTVATAVAALTSCVKDRIYTYEDLYPTPPEPGYIEVYTAEDFAAIDGTILPCYLMADIEVLKAEGEDGIDFSGVFEGNGRTITVEGSPLFNEITADAEVRNLHVAGTSTGSGGLAGTNGGLVECCRIDVAVTDESGPVGGIAGSNEGGVIRNCYQTQKVWFDGGEPTVYVGGIAGNGAGTIEGCLITGVLSVRNIFTESTIVNISGISYDGMVTSCVALHTGVELGGSSMIANTYRIGFLGPLSGNYAALMAFGAIGPDTAQGATVNRTTQAGTEEWWADAEEGIWRTRWGGTDVDTPWKWDAENTRPCLWWE